MTTSQDGGVPVYDQNTSLPDFGMGDSNEHHVRFNTATATMITSNDQILQNRKVLQLLNSDE